ncbi:M12 family metallo-peptidase [Moheibacter sediminis]|uniref:Por secretion system C-terminal sorting domain-containing protein n=1 Tax=Moheibacter sediminis TaxID=1434700 RepID=A0A1W2C5E1_9FLAO|nr:M12 family metallo-peptidase [Moheibacter sediminis]SMC80092.1 Por secretion system C-terminal sorting domain-containing protein [Moheibacter sediminis]
MKKLLFCCITLLNIGLYAQNTKAVAQKIERLETQKTNFKKFNVLNETSQKNTTVENVVNNATLAKIDLNSIHSIYTQKNNALEISIPYQGQEIEIQLYRVNPLSDSFTLKTNKKSSVNYQPGVYYRGIIKDNPNSLVSFSFFEDKFSGIISADEFQNLNIGKLQSVNNTTDYIVYSDLNLKVTNDWTCETDDFVKDAYTDYPSSMIFEGATTTEKCVAMYYEMDYDLFTENNSNLDETMDWMSATFNNMQTLYENDDITIALNEVFIWETQDPYQGSGGSGDYLAAFNNERPNFAGDVGQMIGANDNSGGGIAATIEGICSTENYSYAGVNTGFSTVPTYSWTIMVMTHEHGHVLGSRHTHACVWNGNNTAIDGCAGGVEGNCSTPGYPDEGGLIMSYCHLQGRPGINFALGFGEQPKTVIINNINGKECLSTDCINTCFNTVQGLTLTNVSETEATLNWTDTDEENDEWQYAVRAASSNAPLSWQATNSTSISLDNLAANTYYNAYVRKLCGDVEMAEVVRMFATDADFCSGILFTDSGGNSGNYSDNEDVTRTIVPTNSNEKVKVTFNSFNVENGYDFLYIHDGTDTTAPEITGGGLTGQQNGASFQSSDETGALSFRFVSDVFVTGSGWVAEIECQTLGVDDVSAYLDFSYYPNPVLNQLNIQSKNEILDVAVYNIAGQKLNDKSIKSMDVSLDFSSYPSGTYIVELKFKEKPVRFKIIKK